MSEATNWTGSVSGTNTGTVIVEITRDGTRIEGKLQLFEPGIGQLQARLVGEWTSDDRLSAKLEQFTANYTAAGTLPQSGSIEGTFDAKEGAIRGQWSTDAGTAGEFWWIKVAREQPKPPIMLAVGRVWPAFLQYSRRLAAGTKTLWGKSGIRWNKRYTGWLVIVLEVGLAAFVGYLLIEFFNGN